MTIDHPDYHALLAAVLADPADDMPRLVLADWLQDNAKDVECGRCKRRSDWHDALTDDGRCLDCKGSGRVPNGFTEYGEFVRVQCELAAKSDCPDWCDHDPAQCRVEALRERESNLALKHLRDWFPLPVRGHVAAITDVRFVGIDRTYFFRRGFPDSVTLPLRLWVGDGIGPELVRRCPLTRVTLTDREPAHEIHVNYEIGIPAVGWGWCRVPGAQPDRRHHLPPELFDLLDLPTCPSYPAIKQAPTRQAALDALSAACLTWARQVKAAEPARRQAAAGSGPGS